MSQIRSLVGERQALRQAPEALPAAVSHVASYDQAAQDAVAARLERVARREVAEREEEGETLTTPTPWKAEISHHGLLDAKALAKGTIRVPAGLFRTLTRRAPHVYESLYTTRT